VPRIQRAARIMRTVHYPFGDHDEPVTVPVCLLSEGGMVLLDDGSCIP